MAEEERRVRWPDGVSASVPFLYGRIGGTYYWKPGSPTAPHLTLMRSYGLPGAGLNAVFLRQGMTSNDTLGLGVSGNVSTILPSVTLNGTIPRDGSPLPLPWKSRVTSIEAGIGTPNVSPAITGTYTPQEIANFLTKYVLLPPSGPEWKTAFVRDSAAAAGVPSRNNVFEFGYPDSGTTSPAMKSSETLAGKSRSSVFDTGAPPMPFLAPALGGMPGRPNSMMESGIGSLSSPATSPGGLPGLIQDYLRGNYPANR